MYRVNLRDIPDSGAKYVFDHSETAIEIKAEVVIL